MDTLIAIVRLTGETCSTWCANVGLLVKGPWVWDMEVVYICNIDSILLNLAEGDKVAKYFILRIP